MYTIALLLRTKSGINGIGVANQLEKIEQQQKFRATTSTIPASMRVIHATGRDMLSARMIVEYSYNDGVEAYKSKASNKLNDARTENPPGILSSTFFSSDRITEQIFTKPNASSTPLWGLRYVAPHVKPRSAAVAKER